jgi:hypothetical protein
VGAMAPAGGGHAEPGTGASSTTAACATRPSSSVQHAAECSSAEWHALSTGYLAKTGWGWRAAEQVMTGRITCPGHDLVYFQDSAYLR